MADYTKVSTDYRNLLQIPKLARSWGREGEGELTCMNLALKVNLPLRVVAGSDVNGRHVQTEVALSYALHIAHQARIVPCQPLVPHHRRIIVVLRERERVGR